MKKTAARNILFMTSAAPERAAFSTSEKRPPLGLGCLISVAREEGHKVYFSDEYLRESDILDNGFIQREEIDHIGIYSNTVCFQATLKMLEKIQRMREKGEWRGKILVGGPHTSVDDNGIPDFVDHVVIGEGEITIKKILSGEIKERTVVGEKVEDLDSLPRPAWDEFIHLPYDWSHSWHKIRPIYTMNTSRGCPFNCAFCSVKSIWGKTYRCMSAGRIMDDIKFMIRNYGAKGIYFREDHFTLSKERTIEFCELLLKENIEVDWMCETRVDQLGDYDYQDLMAKAGCKVFYVGVESGSPRMLEFYRKGETREQFIKAFDIAKRVGIKTYASFIVGFPTETDDDRRQTEELIRRIKPDYIGENVFVGLPGSELYDYIREKGLYEYEDENHILYPNGFRANVRKFYGSDQYFQVYSDDDDARSLSESRSNNAIVRLCRRMRDGLFSLADRVRKS